MAQRDKVVIEMIVNMDCQHKGIFVIIFFLTFRFPTSLTNATLKDENTKFTTPIRLTMKPTLKPSESCSDKCKNKTLKP